MFLKKDRGMCGVESGRAEEVPVLLKGPGGHTYELESHTPLEG